MTTPRLRPELHATPAEEQGVKFYDVSDPRSGQKMRLYDFEWLLAAQMDGYRSLDEIARWAEGALHLQVSASNLSTYADKLAELGFFAAAEPEEPAASLRGQQSLGSSVTPLPPPSPGSDMDEDIPLDIADSPDEITETATALPEPIRSPEPRAPEPMRAPPPRPPILEERTDLQTRLPVAEPSITRDLEPPRKSSSSSVIGLLLVLLVVGGVLAYVMWFAPGGAQVNVQPARTRDVVSLYDGSAKLVAAPPQKLSFQEAGKVTDVVAAGTEVKAGMPLVTLDGYPKVEKELADVKDRLAFYQKQHDAAVQKGDAGAQKAADEKVAEKKKLLDELEARVGKLRLTAPGPGLVGKVFVAAGGDAKPGDPALELVDKHVVATFHAPGSTLKVGDQVTVQAGAASASGKLSLRTGDDLTVEVTGGGAVGSEVRLVKSKLTGVIGLPSSALVQVGGADTVFVLADGQVHAHPVKVSDRSGAEVYIGSGLNAGDQVVVSGADALKDGDKASAAASSQ